MEERGERNCSGSIFMNRGRAAKTFALVKYNERVTTWSVRGEITTPIQKPEYRFEGCAIKGARGDGKNIAEAKRKENSIYPRLDDGRKEDFFTLERMRHRNFRQKPPRFLLPFFSLLEQHERR